MTTNAGLAVTAAFALAAVGLAGADSLFFLKVPLFALAEPSTIDEPKIHEPATSPMLAENGTHNSAGETPADATSPVKAMMANKVLDEVVYGLVEQAAQSQLSRTLDQSSVKVGQVIYLPIAETVWENDTAKSETKVEITKSYLTEISNIVDQTSGKTLFKRCVDATILSPIVSDFIVADWRTISGSGELKAVCSDPINLPAELDALGAVVNHDMAQTAPKRKFPPIGPTPPSRF